MSEALPRIPTVEAWDWQTRAACRGQGSAAFFHPYGERGRAREARIVRAKEICHSCAVLMQCRSYALKVEEPYGIWGGMSEQERETYIRKHKGRKAVADSLAEASFTGVKIGDNIA